MLLGYNTNGFAFHRLDDAIRIIAGLGYRCVAITVDNYVLNPYDADIGRQLATTREQVAGLGLASVIETGSRFLLDPTRKHCPTLLDRRSAGRERRLDFLRRCVDIAAQLESLCVSFWSGAVPAATQDDAMFGVLADACRSLAEYAGERNVTLAFEPEPGMLVDTVGKYQRLAAAVDRDNFCLTIDAGHLRCTETEPAAALIRRVADRLANVHLDDMRRGVHEHLFFGDGEVQFEEVFGALQAAGYDGPACVELSRHSQNAVETATRAKAFLGQFV